MTFLMQSHVKKRRKAQFWPQCGQVKIKIYVHILRSPRTGAHDFLNTVYCGKKGESAREHKKG